MTNFTEQIKIAKRLKLKEGDSRRLDCPFCYGHNTYGISLTRGILEWHCFKASCDIKGKIDNGMSIEGIKYHLNTYETEQKINTDIPSLLTNINTHDDIVNYLLDVNSYEAYNRRLVNIKYSPTEDRIMFGIQNDGYIGRSLNFKPKWKKYGNASHLFTCGLGRIGVVVEDAPSACAVGILPDYTGVSLLGTTLTKQHKIELRQFEEIIVCLDPDAASKSFKIKERMEGIRPTTIRLISDDLKYYTPTEIKEILT